MVPRKCMGFWIIRTLTPEDDSDFLGALPPPPSPLPPREGGMTVGVPLPWEKSNKDWRAGIIGVDNCNARTKAILIKKCWDCKRIILWY